MKTEMWQILVFFVLANATVFGQKNTSEDGPVGIFPTRGEYNQFMGEAKRAAYGPNGNRKLISMIPMLNDIALNRPIGSTAGMSPGKKSPAMTSNLSLLSNDRVREELEMVDSQYEELKERNSQIQKRAADQIRQLDFSDRVNLVSRIQAIRDEANNDTRAVLLPHQIDRLKQIRMQALLQQSSLVEVLTSDPVKTELEISRDQAKELKEFESIVQADLAKEIAKLREAARSRLLAKLSATQEKRAKELIGEVFVFESQQKETAKKGTNKVRERK